MWTDDRFCPHTFLILQVGLSFRKGVKEIPKSTTFTNPT